MKRNSSLRLRVPAVGTNFIRQFFCRFEHFNLLNFREVEFGVIGFGTFSQLKVGWLLVKLA